MDTAGGGEDGDFAAVQVVDRETGLQCAELQERLRPAELAQVAAELGEGVSRCAGCGGAQQPWRRGAGVLETSERYTELYAQRARGWLADDCGLEAGDDCAGLGPLLEQRPELFQKPGLLGECRTFVGRERGKTGAASGAHDDLVMAMAMAQAVRAEMLMEQLAVNCWANAVRC